MAIARSDNPDARSALHLLQGLDTLHRLAHQLMCTSRGSLRGV